MKESETGPHLPAVAQPALTAAAGENSADRTDASSQADDTGRTENAGRESHHRDQARGM